MARLSDRSVPSRRKRFHVQFGDMGLLKFTTGQGSIVYSVTNGEDISLNVSTSDTGAAVDPLVAASLWHSAHPSVDAVEPTEMIQDEALLPPIVASKLQSYKAGHLCNHLGQFPLLDLTKPNDTASSLSADTAFDESTSSDDAIYSLDVARQLSAVSGWSYSDVETFRDKLSDDTKTSLTNADYCQLSVRNDAMFIVATAQIIRTRDCRVVIVCFRGTEVTNVVNWATDATTRLVPWLDYDGVHEGFVRNLEAIWYGPKGVLAHLLAPCMLRKGYDYDDPQHFATISDPSRNEQDLLEAVYITGHSLGGAMALLASLDLEHSLASTGLWSKLRGVYTYGQPMALSPLDAQLCVKRGVAAKVFRHVYYNDVIPHVPPRSTGEYAHVGREFRYYPPTCFGATSIGQWHETPESSIVTQIWLVLGAAPFVLADGLVDTLPWLAFVKFSWSILDHNPIRYIDAMYGEGRVSERGVRVVLQALLGVHDPDQRRLLLD